MKYITHRRFKALAMCGEVLNIPYGTELEAADGCLTTGDGKAVCICRSENGVKHFAINEDGRGLERGALTYAIAYGSRRRKGKDGGIYRFSDGERDRLVRDWGRFLQNALDFVLFNDDFFTAQVEDLQRLASVLNIKIKK